MNDLLNYSTKPLNTEELFQLILEIVEKTVTTQPSNKKIKQKYEIK